MDTPAFGPQTNQVIQTNQVTIGGVPTNIITTNFVRYVGDYVPVKGTLVFDDFEMSKTILIPIKYRSVTAQSNLVFGIQLSNPALDPYESTDVSAPRVDPVFGTAEIRVLNSDADPYGPETTELSVTNEVVDPLSGATNEVVSITNILNLASTNAVFNFEKVNYRVPADVNDSRVSPWTEVTLSVERFGTNTSAQTINYRVNNWLSDDADGDEEKNIWTPLSQVLIMRFPRVEAPPGREDGLRFGIVPMPISQ